MYFLHRHSGLLWHELGRRAYENEVIGRPGGSLMTRRVIWVGGNQTNSALLINHRAALGRQVAAFVGSSEMPWFVPATQVASTARSSATARPALTRGPRTIRSRQDSYH